MNDEPAQLGGDGEAPSAAQPPANSTTSLNTAVRRRRADHDFYLRLASTTQHHERAIARLR
jgi:hypothetical protein